MKKNITLSVLALAGALLWSGCMQLEEKLVGKESPAEEGQKWNLTVKAERETPDQGGNDGASTKGLVLDGTALNTLWKSSETVSVFAKTNYLAETLAVTPDAENAKLADLTGSVTLTGINVNDVLTLQVPRQTWDYTGQKGLLLGPDVAGSIEKDYAYALADVTVEGITPGTGDAGTLTTSNAHFVNQQKIYRISFKLGGDELCAKDMTVTSSKGKIVLSRDLATGTSTYGALTVSMDGDSGTLADGLICVALRNEDETEQDYFFSVTGQDLKTYVGTKHIPAEAFTHNFLGIKDMALTQLTLTKSSTTVDTAL